MSPETNYPLFLFFHNTVSLQTPEKQGKNAPAGVRNLIPTLSPVQCWMQIEAEMRPCAQSVALLSLPPSTGIPLGAPGGT